LLFDLLTVEEARDRRNVFDVELLARRLILATAWVRKDADTRDLAIGYFGASTGAAAALVAESAHEEPIAAIVSRGGRPDLAGRALPAISAPTLLIVGGDDVEVLALNRAALAKLPAKNSSPSCPVPRTSSKSRARLRRSSSMRAAGS
jgi:dienelactone hydrolase